MLRSVGPDELVEPAKLEVPEEQSGPVDVGPGIGGRKPLTIFAVRPIKFWGPPRRSSPGARLLLPFNWIEGLWFLHRIQAGPWSPSLFSWVCSKMKWVNNRVKKIKGLTILPFSAANTVFRLPSPDALRRIASNSSISVRNWVGVTGIEAEWNGWRERLRRTAGQSVGTWGVENFN